MRVAIIGAGVSGIVALKSCLEENLDAVCFEQRETYGGLWEHKANPIAGETTVTERVICNTSKEMMAFSDFPPPKEFPLFMPQKKYKEYLELYVENFNLKPNMKFNSKINKCYNEGNKWHLKIEDLKTNLIREEIFDAVMVCHGITRKPKWPKYPGMSSFSGKIFHAQQYRDPSDYSGQTVLVIGMGNTGSETAVELTQFAKKVYISSLNGKWLFLRLNPEGVPNDTIFLRRWKETILSRLPVCIQHLYAKQSFKLDQKLFGWDQNGYFTLSTTTVNDELPNRISSGKIIVKPDVEKFTPNEVFFVDGTVLTDIDTVIIGTGYEKDFPFLEKSTLDIEDDKVFAYKNMFPPDLVDKNFALIGCVYVFGSKAPTFEIQARLAARVFKGLVKLPPKDVMIEETKKSILLQDSTPVMTYQDELCEMIGCKPNLWRLLFTDPSLAVNIFLGPFSPYQFRLTGPGKWSGARTAVLEQWKRMHYSSNKDRKSALSPWIKDFFVFLIKLVFFTLIVILIFFK